MFTISPIPSLDIVYNLSKFPVQTCLHYISYPQCAAAALESNLLKYSAKDHFFRSHPPLHGILHPHIEVSPYISSISPTILKYLLKPSLPELPSATSA